VRDGRALRLQTVAHSARRSLEVLLVFRHLAGACLYIDRRRRREHRNCGGRGNLFNRFLEGLRDGEQLLALTSSFSDPCASSVFRSASAAGCDAGQMAKHAAAHGIERGGFLLRVHAGVQRLRFPRPVAVNGHGLDALPPALRIGLRNFFNGGSCGRFTVFEIAPERKGCAAAIILMCPM